MITHPPVKVNLGLNVLRKRDDGYHDIETLFVESRQFSDTLEIISGDDYSRTSARLAALYGGRMAGRGGDDVEGSEVPMLSQGISPDGKLMMTVAREEGVDWDVTKDLCARAYKMLDEEYGLPPVKIFLEKTSPVGAGLGGGSADAAYTLRMLSDIAGLHLDDGCLADHAARLGSDCAFFIFEKPMLGEGRGEILTPFDLGTALSDPGEGQPRAGGYELKIVVPEGIHVSTAEAYKGIVPAVPERRLRDVLRLPVPQWRDCLVNDFERTVFAVHPELAEIKRSLYDAGAVYASMSGSGSALFALYEV